MLNFHLNLENPYKLQIPQAAFFSLLSQSNDFIFIKDSGSQYAYGNQAFLELMGLKSLKSLLKRSDSEFCKDKKKVKTYRQHDEEVLETEKALVVKEEVYLQGSKDLKKEMAGSIYPIFTDVSSKPVAVMGVVRPWYLAFKLTLEMALSLDKTELEGYFLKRSYPVKMDNQCISLSKRELQCIIELLKGKNAREIADTLHLQKTTIEFYLENIKNKLGATSKSSLIATVLNQKILQQIIL